MLKSLSVENYALIEKADVIWRDGFSVITGETGSGKSILLGALSLIQGNRADVKVLKNPERKCVVEAEFDISNYSLQSFFDENDLDFDNICIIRREISPNGKSRAFINDVPAPLSVLKSLTAYLIDIHSQHATLLLSQDEFQLQVLDALADTGSIRNEYTLLFRDFSTKKKNLSELLSKLESQNSNKDYLEFQLNQLREANFSENEQSELEDELAKLSHISELKEVLEKTQWHLTEKEDSICASLHEVSGKMQELSTVYEETNEWGKGLGNALIELKEIAREVESRLADVTIDPQRIEFIHNRLDLIYTLEKKHKVDDIKGLLSLQNNFEKELELIENSDEAVNELKACIEEQRKELEQLSNTLTLQRKKAKQPLEQSICDILHGLGIPNAKFEAEFEELADFSANGKDKITFLFSANKNGSLQSISNVASGGELSRVMLALKSILSKHENLPTIILDEIDTGVSGEVADKMGELMKKMGEYMQVVSITHLPQIAAKCSTHFKVYKEDDEESTVSHIIELSEEERIKEIAQMLSGSNLTEVAIENAKVLMGLK
jgi:DNA repair protein RecN (Recombination protein N)